MPFCQISFSSNSHYILCIFCAMTIIVMIPFFFFWCSFFLCAFAFWFFGCALVVPARYTSVTRKFTGKNIKFPFNVRPLSYFKNKLCSDDEAYIKCIHSKQDSLFCGLFWEIKSKIITSKKLSAGDVMFCWELRSCCCLPVKKEKREDWNIYEN